MTYSTLLLRHSANRWSITSHPLRRAAQRFKSTTAAGNISHAAIEPPTARQLRQHFLQSAVPMIGFGLMDQTVMLQAGNAIDCTIGVTFGLSTLTAAAMGQICSDAAGVLSGGTLERIGIYMGLASPHFSHAQRSLPTVRYVGLIGQLLGVVFGCTLGLLNLLWMDTERSSTLKLRALAEEHEFAFEVEASNAVRDDATVLTVKGPDVHGLLASLTATLSAHGYSLLELHAGSARNEQGEASMDNAVDDTFVIVNDEHEQIPDDELDILCNAILEATSHPINIQTFKVQREKLQNENHKLMLRVEKLEQMLRDRQISIVPKMGGSLMATSSSDGKTKEGQESDE